MKQWFKKRRPHPQLAHDSSFDESYIDVLADDRPVDVRQDKKPEFIDGLGVRVDIPATRPQRRSSTRMADASSHITGVSVRNHHLITKRASSPVTTRSHQAAEASQHTTVSPHVLDLSS